MEKIYIIGDCEGNAYGRCGSYEEAENQLEDIIAELTLELGEAETERLDLGIITIEPK